MTFVDQVSEKLRQALEANTVEIIDDSWKHAGHAGNRGPHTDGTHLQVRIVSQKFAGLSLLDQHRLVHQILKPEMDTRIHALTLKLETPTAG